MDFTSVTNSDYFQFTIILAISICIGLTLHMFLKKFAKKFLRKQRWGFFGLLYILVVIIGLYFALHSLTSLEKYDTEIDGFFFIVVLLLSALVTSRIVNILVTGWLRVRKKLEKIPQIFSMLLSVFIFIIALAIIFAYYKIEITPLIATLGIGALAIGLALQSTLANLFAGMHIVTDKPINIGNFIELDENTSGTVDDIGWRSTRIRTLRDTTIVIPNAKLADSTLINMSLPIKEMAIFVECGVAYESNLDKVAEVAIDVAKYIQQTSEGAVRDFEPFVRYRNFGESNIEFITILRVSDPLERFRIRHEFIIALKKRFDEESIEISWPIRKIYQRK